MKKTTVILIAVLWIIGVSGGCDCGTHKYKAFTLAPLPGWTDKYADSNKGDMSYFMMSELVKDFKLTRLQAIELQNHFRDLTAGGEEPDKAFDEALKRVRDFKFESRLEPEKLKHAKFIVAIDMDETLLQQYYKKWKEGSDYYDYKIKFEDGERGVSMAPGWQQLLQRIKNRGGLVVIYSANVDDVVWKIAYTVTIGEKKLAEYVDGVMTNSYLILQGKHEWVPKGKTGNPVVTPSKDLRFLDEALEKVIIIDDNPKRIIQDSRLRLPKKYQADLYYGSKDEIAKKAYEHQLLHVAAEIEESALYAEAHGINFARAYLPYTELGNAALEWLVETKTLTEEDAVEYIRQHPDIVDKKF